MPRSVLSTKTLFAKVCLKVVRFSAKINGNTLKCLKSIRYQFDSKTACDVITYWFLFALKPLDGNTLHQLYSHEFFFFFLPNFRQFDWKVDGNM